jgi:hypothetical protein
MVAAPCACGKFACAKMYPLNDVPNPAELMMSLRFAAYVVPEFTLAVVKVLDVPSFLYRLNVIVPAVGVAPPPVEPNGSVVVFEIAIPVLKPGTTTA